MKNRKILLGGFLGSALIAFLLLAPSLLPFSLAEDQPPSNSLPSKDSRAVGEESQLSGVLSLTEIFERTEAGVVSITVKKTSAFQSSGVGSGFVYDDQGHIITNNHVVDGSQKNIVTFIDGRSYEAKVVGTDPYTDIAVLKISADKSALHPLTLGDSSKLKVGERVTAIGNPYGLSGSMTSGIVSQLGRLLPSQGTGFSIPDIIQTDAAINPGNSGGPLLNMHGDVIGINTAIFSSSGTFSGVGFSIPSDIVSKIIPQLIKTGEYKHTWIGVTSQNIDPDMASILGLKDAKGTLIMTVVKDGPADKAGIRGSSQTHIENGIEYQIGGDIIVGVDGNEVRKIDDVITYLQREKNVGDEIILNIIRDGKSTDIIVKLEERPTVFD